MSAPPLPKRHTPSVRTSKTDPIRVDFLPREACPLPGRIGMTLAPGKNAPGGNWRRDLEQDLRHLREARAASLLVCLLQEPELSLLGIEDLWALSRAEGIRTMHLPIPDSGVPGAGPPSSAGCVAGTNSSSAATRSSS